MDDKFAQEIVSLLKEVKSLLEKSINIYEEQLRLFQSYDANLFKEEEEQRELQQRNSRINSSENKSILGNPGR